ncbi:MAG: hypothetical protein CMJ70_08345 [Planctomycetaceae bacterium]|nr:hypothetical protein [Planctomycetaceae bacterium]HAA71111.1 hypothetical protein [Planctomycetaceae bacterium]
MPLILGGGRSDVRWMGDRGRVLVPVVNDGPGEVECWRASANVATPRSVIFISEVTARRNSR